MGYNTIRVDSKYGVRGEATGSGAITPGFLLERDSTDKVKAHATAGGRSQRMFAIEDDLQGKGITDDYANGALIQYMVFKPGDLVNALIANDENISIGDYLSSNGDGTLKKMVEDSSATIKEEKEVAVAREACDMTGSSGADNPRCLVEIV